MCPGLQTLPAQPPLTRVSLTALRVPEDIMSNRGNDLLLKLLQFR